jgi:hypothetical protein
MEMGEKEQDGIATLCFPCTQHAGRVNKEISVVRFAFLRKQSAHPERHKPTRVAAAKYNDFFAVPTISHIGVMSLVSASKKNTFPRRGGCKGRWGPSEDQ